MTDFDGWALVGPDGKVYWQSTAITQDGAWSEAWIFMLCQDDSQKRRESGETYQNRLASLGYRVAKVKIVEVRDE